MFRYCGLGKIVIAASDKTVIAASDKTVIAASDKTVIAASEPQSQPPPPVIPSEVEESPAIMETDYHHEILRFRYATLRMTLYKDRLRLVGRNDVWNLKIFNHGKIL